MIQKNKILVMPKNLQKHKQIKKKCHHPYCTISPSFNYKHKKTPIYCNHHKIVPMINILKPKCFHEKCMDYPCYNYPKEMRGIFCHNHKKDGMVDVISSKCVADDCQKYASFNIPGNYKPIYCSEHKHELMVDVKHKTCEYKNCDTIGSFSYPFSKNRFCSKHKTLPMIHYHKKPRCRTKKCKEQPIYSVSKDKLPEWCLHHRPEFTQLYDLHRQNCSSCELKYPLTHIYLLNDNYYCEYCVLEYGNYDKNEANFAAYEKFYNDNNLYVKATHSIKIEKKIMNIIQEYISDLMGNNLIISMLDVKFDNSYECTKRRPDGFFLIDLKSYILKLIIEIDEHQHKSYDCICEQSRMIEISNNLHLSYNSAKSERILFIRFNPDNYKSSGKQKYTHIDDRIINLKQFLSHVFSETQTLVADISVCYMYYDDYKLPIIENLHTI